MSLENFEIISEIGKGAYSNVYKVRRHTDQQIYALKKVKMQKLNKKEKKNALNEVRILASINHPNIISYKEAFFDETGSLCLVMEFADSGDLYQKIVKYQKRKKLISESFIWKVLVQVTQGLKVLHELKILHRDMKSANVFINNDGSVKLGDMNVSKVSKDGLLYTQTGTPYYASPEVWQDKPYNSKSDIWSLGCVLYEAATLRPPFRADDMQGLFEKVVKGEYSPISSFYSKDLNFMIRKLLQIDPGKRPNCEQIMNFPCMQKHLMGKMESNEPCTLLEPIAFTGESQSFSEDLPKANYNYRNKSEVPSLYRTPSKVFNMDSHKTLNKRHGKYSIIRAGDVIKESYAELKLPKIKYYSYKSPVIVRKMKEIDELLEMPRSLPDNDRLKRLRNAYLGKSFKIF